MPEQLSDLALHGGSVAPLGAASGACPLAQTGPTEPESGVPLKCEHDFYQQYGWSLNPFPSVEEAVGHLQEELAKLEQYPESWQSHEVLANIILLSGGINNALEDFAHPRTYRLPRRLGIIPFSHVLVRSVNRAVRWWRNRRLGRCWAWKQDWDVALAALLENAPIARCDQELIDLKPIGLRLAELLPPPFPRDLLAQQLQLPSAFRRQDLTLWDAQHLGRRLVDAFPNKQEPFVLVGLRTSGSFLAPVLRAYLKNSGYANLDVVTVRPGQEPNARERDGLRRCAARGHRAVIVDDPPGTGNTLNAALELLEGAGFSGNRIVALLPIRAGSSLPTADITTIVLPRKDWHKAHLLEPARVEILLLGYFQALGFRRIRLVPSLVADRIDAPFQKAEELSRGTRLKRVFEVRAEDAGGEWHTRFVLAKSVGWGWMSYHAFLIGTRLARFVPPVLGLRDGILYTEWLMPEPVPSASVHRHELIDTAAWYVAERARCLPLATDPGPGMLRNHRYRAIELLCWVFEGVYTSESVRTLMRGSMMRRLAELPKTAPVLIDGRMRSEEWIRTKRGLLKTDFEHHGLGKVELNATDPAFDLADFIFHLDLSAAEEARLLSQYRQASGDRSVDRRLFINKLLSAFAVRTAALDGLDNPRQSERQGEFHRHFVDAWNFLTVQSVRHCGLLCRRPVTVAWRAPLVVLDIDGVVDRRLFGFPTTTAASLEALALLHAHGFTLAMNSARSCMEVREYCQGYGLAGGIGEYGSWMWDAVTGRERLLVSEESLGQMERLRQALAAVPGVFLNDTYRYSIRASTYHDGAAVPIAALTVRRLLADLALDRLRFHQTSIDTTVVAAEVDKGTGLKALLDWVGIAREDTTAVGDSPPDLPMFRVAGRSFAPAQMGQSRATKLAGCQVVDRAHQPGLLAIARTLAHADGTTCPRCDQAAEGWPVGDLFFDLLRAADRPRTSLLLRAMFDRGAWEILVKR